LQLLSSELIRRRTERGNMCRNAQFIAYTRPTSLERLGKGRCESSSQSAAKLRAPRPSVLDSWREQDPKEWFLHGVPALAAARARRLALTAGKSARLRA
jgi:hypothetical protein